MESTGPHYAHLRRRDDYERLSAQLSGLINLTGTLDGKADSLDEKVIALDRKVDQVNDDTSELKAWRREQVASLVALEKKSGKSIETWHIVLAALMFMVTLAGVLISAAAIVITIILSHA